MTPLEIIGAGFLAIGGFFCVVGGLGLVRMPDFYTRAHAASVTDTLGAYLIIVGLLCFGFDYGAIVSIKLLMIAGFMFLTGPTAGHALCKAAFESGVEPELSEDRT